MNLVMDPLARFSDDQLRSLVGQIHAELTHRQRVRASDFREAVRLIEERERNPQPSVLRSASAGRSALAAQKGGVEP